MGILSTVINGVKDVAYDKPWQKGFWYEQQEYNTPKNQVQRLDEAGLNPALMLGNIQSGQGASIAPTNPNIATGVTDSILSLINNKKQQRILDANANKVEKDATLSEIRGYTQLTRDLQEIKESLSRENKNKAEIIQGDILANAQDLVSRASVGEAASRTELNWLNYAKGLKELEFLPKQQRLEYAERMAAIAQMSAVTETEKERKKKLIEETNHEYFKAQGQKFVNSLNEKTEQFLIRERRLQGVPKNPWETINSGLQSAHDLVKSWFNN